MWIWSCNSFPLTPPIALRIQCKYHVGHKCLLRLYPDPVQHATTTHAVHTRNAEPLAIPNSMPLCPGLLPWNVLSVQLLLPQVYVCFIPTPILMLKASISSRKSFLISHPNPVSVGSLPGGPLLGNTWPSLWKEQTIIWWSGHLFTLLSPRPGPFSYTYSSVIAASTFSGISLILVSVL